MYTTPTQQRTRFWLPWSVFALSLLVFLSSWWSLNRLQTGGINGSSLLGAQLVKELVTRELGERFRVLDMIAERWENRSEDEYRAALQPKLSEFMANHPGFEAFGYVSVNASTRWVLPSDSPINVVDLLQLAESVTAARAARETGEQQFTDLIDIRPGKRGFMAIRPIYRTGSITGFLAIVVSTVAWQAFVIPDIQQADYSIALRLDGEPIAPLDPTIDAVNYRWTQTADFNFHGMQWQVRFTPRPSLFTAVYTTSPAVGLAVSVLLSALLGWGTRTMLKSREQYRSKRISEQRLTSLLKNIPGMAYRCSDAPEWPVIFASEGCRELCGYTRADFEQGLITISELVHPDDRVVWNSTQRQIGGNRTVDVEYRIRTRGGEVKWVLDKMRSVPGVHSETTQIDGLIMDITEQKQAQYALADAESFAQAVVDTAVEAVISTDSRGNIETFNHAAEVMFDISVSSVLGSDIRQLMPEPHRNDHESYMHRYLDTGQARIIGIGRDLQAVRRDGSRFPIQLSLSEMEHQGRRKFVALIRDLSAQRAAEKDARDQREQLAHVDRVNLLGEMATGIAHEINQPLSAIAMYAQSARRLLSTGASSTARLPEVLEKLATQSLRAGNIIERMQQLASRHESRRELIDCNRLIDEVRALAEAEARVRDMAIDLHLCEQTPSVLADPVQIQQVVLNLLRNGMEATQSVKAEAGSEEADSEEVDLSHIELCTDLDAGSVRVCVFDAGTGVSDEAAERLFQPFSSTKSTGMGIGLSICHSIINDHGGTLTFRNLIQGGACFCFTLPFASHETSRHD